MEAWLPFPGNNDLLAGLMVYGALMCIDVAALGEASLAFRGAQTVRATAAGRASVAGRVRWPAWSYGDTEGALGVTDPFGNITIQPGLTGRALRETLRHESIHSRLTPVPGRFLSNGRANFGHWAYNNSSLVRYIEVAVAEGYATGSIATGLRFPVDRGYVTWGGVFGEGAIYFGGIGGGVYAGATQ